MVRLKSKKEIAVLAQGGKILSEILYQVAEMVRPGITTFALNEKAEFLIKKAGASPSFKGFGGYPSSLCVSIDYEVVHGIPDKNRVLRQGQIVGLDLGIRYKKLYTDMAMTVGVGEISESAKRLIKVTENALELGLKEIIPGKHLGDLGAVIQKFVESQGFSVVRDLTGHGVGYMIHEDPVVPNYGRKGTGELIKQGMVLAIEPMVNMGDFKVQVLKDNWTIVTLDKSLSAHFEQTVAVTEDGYQILTPFWVNKSLPL